MQLSHLGLVFNGNRVKNSKIYKSNYAHKTMYHKRGIIVLLLLLLSFSVIAQDNKIYHLKLLAVQDNGKSIEGSDADLYLELKEG